ncbi:DNA polymerase IV [[Actinomadura] parvosata subsp. kistnae]|uniref:DNA polymerase IV n=2 Tax=Nonomuraea TaxID=83681 RepID=A0A1V0A3N5_9ACTN|nr:DNA polymerase IV [Nonomuraea sp. ATCC 55076]AQZ64820.1 DNA polymerase IV [Nonomuraea sp. ATCC 55076]NJP98015.1 DNA polymerase IV [Nonomuraea sp. FMUSA5-5]SPL96018.1 DNA polymerase IV [Actinomadura parvosata subsp. kistnae]
MSRKQITGIGPAPRTGVDDSGCPILHVDMDAFFASVELLDRPELRGRPVIVGSPAGRGVVLSATYEARAFGVHSAMPMSRARRLCPQATIIPPSHGKYSEVSKGVMEIFHSITPLVEPIASDEAFLDVGGARRRLGPPATVAAMIREQVLDRYGITCSVGVASSKFVAKLASKQCKPDGLLVVPADQVVDFLHPLPVSALWGVGERTEQSLVRLGIRTVGDLARVPSSTLQRELGQAVGAHLAALAWGRDERPVTAHVPDKSIGNEETFAADVDDPDVIKRELLRLSERVAARMRKAGHVGRTVSVKLRRADFTTINRSRTLREPTDVAQVIYATACELFEAAGLDRVRLRLVGVRMENLRPADEATRQLALGEKETGWREAEQAMDKAIRRFGPDAVLPASLVRGKLDEIET